MGETTAIGWTDHTFNPWWGCERVSPGCQHCYAERFAKRTGNDVWGRTAPRRFFGPKHWAEPERWNAAALRDGLPAFVFCASMADVFEDRRDLDGEIRTPAELMPRCSTDTSPVVVRLDTNGNWQYPVLGGFDTVAEARAFAVALHRRSMLGTRVVLDGLIDHELYLAPLRGKNLACWCPLDQPCHADVLLELANEDMVKEGRL